jgi:hypothetical protein
MNPIWIFVPACVAFVTFLTVYGPRWQRAYARRPERALRRMQTTAIAALKPDQPAKVTGVISPRDDLVKSPIGGLPCIGFQVVIEGAEPFSFAHYPETPEGRHVLFEREACGVFTLTDDTGTVVVDGPYRLGLGPYDGAWADPTPSVFALLQEKPVPDALADWPSWRRLRYQEAVLKPGDRVSVLGQPSMEVDRAAVASYRDPPILTHIKGTQDEPVLVIDEKDSAT